MVNVVELHSNIKGLVAESDAIITELPRFGFFEAQLQSFGVVVLVAGHTFPVLEEELADASRHNLCLSDTAIFYAVILVADAAECKYTCERYRYHYFTEREAANLMEFMWHPKFCMCLFIISRH